jgi:glycosyltransferase involved in cell wall biosynthesis
LGRNPRPSPKSLFTRQVIRVIYSRFAAFLYVGEANRSYFRHHGVLENKLFFAPHAVDNARFIGSAPEAQEEARLWRRQIGIPQDNQLILFAGKLEEKKRPQDLLEAFFQARLPNVSLLFVGNGALEEKLRTRAAVDSNVFFAPFQNQSQMPRTYASADIYVLPSAGFQETWGLAVNEAMCMSRPVIVSNQVGCAENLISTEKNGLVFRAGDVAGLANALRFSLEKPGRLKQWGDESRRIIENYSYSQATAGLENALSMLGVMKK